MTMKGNPLRQLGLVFLLLGAVFLPVRMVTRHAPVFSDTLREKSVSSTGKQTLHTGTLAVKAAPHPLSLSVTHQGQELLPGAVPAVNGEYKASVSLPGDADLLVSARWGDDAPHAVRVEFSPEGAYISTARDFWSGRELRDVMTLPATSSPR